MQTSFLLSQKRHGIKFFCFHLLFTPDGFAQIECIIECLLKDQKNQSHYLNIRWITQDISSILRISKPQKRKTYKKKLSFTLLPFWHQYSGYRNKYRFWCLEMFLHCFLTFLLFYLSVFDFRHFYCSVFFWKGTFVSGCPFENSFQVNNFDEIRKSFNNLISTCFFKHRGLLYLNAFGDKMKSYEFSVSRNVPPTF